MYGSMAFYTSVKIFFSVSVGLVAEEIFMWPLLGPYKSAVSVHRWLQAIQQCVTLKS